MTSVSNTTDGGVDHSLSHPIQVAIILKRMVPNHMFSSSMALVCAGYGYEAAVSKDNLSKFNFAMQYVTHQYGEPNYSLDMESNFERFKHFIKFAKRWPNSKDLKTLEQVDLKNPNLFKNEISSAMKLTGAPHELCQAGAYYMKCSRFQRSLKKEARITH